MFLTDGKNIRHAAHYVKKKKIRLAVYLFLMYKSYMELLSTNEAAARLGISVRRVQALIKAGQLAAHKLGRDYAIEESSLNSVKVYGKSGRPPKAKGESAKLSKKGGKG